MIRVNQQDRSHHTLNMPINVFFKSLGAYLSAVYLNFSFDGQKDISKKKQLGLSYLVPVAMEWMALGP